jgi:hypothetical protein
MIRIENRDACHSPQLSAGDSTELHGGAKLLMHAGHRAHAAGNVPAAAWR